MARHPSNVGRKPLSLSGFTDSFEYCIPRLCVHLRNGGNTRFVRDGR
jgi:hypothetical protein